MKAYHLSKGGAPAKVSERYDQPLYTHANPGEVERLSIELDQCDAMATMVAEHEWAEHVGTGPVSSKVEAAFTQLYNDLYEAGE